MAGGVGFYGAVCQLMMLIVGAGVLAVPYTFREMGWSAAYLYVACAALMGNQFYIVGRCTVAENKAAEARRGAKCCTFDMLAEQAWGTDGRMINFVTVFSILDVLLTPAVYITIVGTSLSAVFPGVSLQAGMMLSACVAATLMLMDFKGLSWLSMLSNVGIMLSAAALVQSGTALPAGSHDVVAAQYETFRPQGVPLSIGIIFFGFGGVVCYPSMVCEMEVPEQCGLVLAVAFFLLTVLYCSLGAAGYWFFGDSLAQSFVLNLGRDLDRQWMPGSPGLQTVQRAVTLFVAFNVQLALVQMLMVLQDTLLHQQQLWYERRYVEQAGMLLVYGGQLQGKNHRDQVLHALKQERQQRQRDPIGWHEEARVVDGWVHKDPEHPFGRNLWRGAGGTGASPFAPPPALPAGPAAGAGLGYRTFVSAADVEQPVSARGPGADSPERPGSTQGPSPEGDENPPGSPCASLPSTASRMTTTTAAEHLMDNKLFSDAVRDVIEHQSAATRFRTYWALGCAVAAAFVALVLADKVAAGMELVGAVVAFVNDLVIPLLLYAKVVAPGEPPSLARRAWHAFTWSLLVFLPIVLLQSVCQIADSASGPCSYFTVETNVQHPLSRMRYVGISH